MATEQLACSMEKMDKGCGELALQLAQLTEEDLAQLTPHEWAPTVKDFLVTMAAHTRDHARQIAVKREALGLEQTTAQKLLADVMAAQGELNAVLVGLDDEDLPCVPSGQNWCIGEVTGHMTETSGWFLSEIEKALKG